MSAAPVHDSEEKLTRAIVARESVQDLYAQAFAPGVRILHRMLESLPLSMIPATLAWTFLSITLLQMNSMRSLQLYLAGLFVLAAAALSLVAVVRLLGRTTLDDEVLERLADGLAGLAYYPNALLKDRIREKGFANCWDFYLWYREQTSILATRIRDLKAQCARAAVPPTPHVTLRSEAANRFLQS
jgi:hypothetical protein